MTSRRMLGAADPAGAARLLGLVAILSACVRLPHPDLLGGQWVDTAHTTASDTSIWILKPNGDDLALRVAGTSVGDGGARVAPRPELYGRWYLSGDFADTAGRALCFNQRPGRSAPSCVHFRLDTVLVGGQPRRRLLLAAYEGSHSAADRVLIERRP
ncbi:MAG: hypothetical protein ACHQX4_07485 [Gemmatimonadales bacterium]